MRIRSTIYTPAPYVHNGEVALFYGRRSPFSNMYSCQVRWAGHTYISSEAAYQASKCRFFGDYDQMRRIKACTNSFEAKILGKKVKGFSQEKWDGWCQWGMESILMAKFQQNEDLGDHLLDTYGFHLAESSPSDLRWGTGLAYTHPLAYEESCWPGKNWQGELLMYVRKQLIKERDLERQYPDNSERTEILEYRERF
jgi:ribA/ribD-fused uncharacterized protein